MTNRSIMWAAARSAALIVALCAGWVGSGAAAQEWSPPRTVYVESAGHTVDGYFLDAWRSYGTLLGEPITEEFASDAPLTGEATNPDDDDSDASDQEIVERDEDHIVQYYENLALVYVPEEERPEWQVQALPLGRETMALDRERFPSMKLATSGSCGSLDEGSCLEFDETRHTLRYGFKTFWENNGGEPLLGLPISEEFVSSDGYTTQYFERVVLRWREETGVEPRPTGEEAAKRLKLPMTRIEQPDEIPIYDEALFIAPEPEVLGVGADSGTGPGPQQGASKEIVISISAQSIWAYEEGEVVISSLVSTGVGNVPETVTPVGTFQILTKLDTETMEGTISDEYYLVEDVPSVMYFDNNGNAIHGTYWHSNFGTPMSHGCVNLPLDIAAFLYEWAPVGTAVTVIP